MLILYQTLCLVLSPCLSVSRFRSICAFIEHTDHSILLAGGKWCDWKGESGQIKRAYNRRQRESVLPLHLTSKTKVLFVWDNSYFCGGKVVRLFLFFCISPSHPPPHTAHHTSQIQVPLMTINHLHSLCMWNEKNVYTRSPLFVYHICVGHPLSRLPMYGLFFVLSLSRTLTLFHVPTRVANRVSSFSLMQESTQTHLKQLQTLTWRGRLKECFPFCTHRVLE